MKKDKKFFYIFIVITIVLFLIACYRSFISSITMDEALTYKEFIIKNSLFNFNSKYAANNHLLNTFFISIFNKFSSEPYNEFIIRLPNLIFYIIYLIFTYKISKLYKNKYLISSILLFNYSINEFFSVGRGYGIASALVLGGIYFYKLWLKDNNQKNLFKSCFFLITSCLANTITLIIYFLFAIDCIIRLIKNKNLKDFIISNKIKLLLILIFTILICIFHFYISYRDPKLWYCKSDLYSCLALAPISYYGFSIFNDSIKNLFIILVFLIYIILLLRNYKKINNSNIFYIIFINLLIFIIIKLIFPFNVPAVRSLIPFFGIFCICFMEIVDLEKNKHLQFIITIFIIIISLICFFKNVSFKYIREWQDNQNIKRDFYNHFYDIKLIKRSDINDSNCFSYQFYYNKLMYKHKNQ